MYCIGASRSITVQSDEGQSVRHSIRDKDRLRDEMEKAPWDVGRNGVVVVVGWGSEGKGKKRRKNMFSGKVYPVCGIRSLDIRQGALQCYCV